MFKALSLGFKEFKGVVFWPTSTLHVLFTVHYKWPPICQVRIILSPSLSLSRFLYQLNLLELELQGVKEAMELHDDARSSESPSSEEDDLRKGPWTVEEDLLLMNYIAVHGEGRWNSVARCSGSRSIPRSLIVPYSHTCKREHLS